MTANQIAWQNMLETRRANVARELETNRSNVARETETNRANVAKEGETKRHNVATEVEAGRHNRSTESLGFSNLSELGRHNLQTEAVNWYNAQEVKRANQANEAIKWLGLGNQQIELGIKQQDADTREFSAQSQKEHWEGQREETHRSNVSNEAIQEFRNILASTELQTKIEQFDRAQTETERHNRMNEIMDAIGQVGGLYRDIVGTNLNAGAKALGFAKGSN